MKRFKHFIQEEDHPYKMTYRKSVSDGKGDIAHHEFRHVTHKLEGRPQTPEGARGMISRTKKHQELKAQGYSPHQLGDHDKDRKDSYGRPVKHVHDED